MGDTPGPATLEEPATALRGDVSPEEVDALLAYAGRGKPSAAVSSTWCEIPKSRGRPTASEPKPPAVDLIDAGPGTRASMAARRPSVLGTMPGRPLNPIRLRREVAR